MNARDRFSIGQLVRFNENAPARWSAELHARGKVYAASDVCKVVGFARDPNFVRVIQEGRKTPITIRHELLGKREEEVSDARVPTE